MMAAGSIRAGVTYLRRDSLPNALVQHVLLSTAMVIFHSPFLPATIKLVAAIERETGSNHAPLLRVLRDSRKQPRSILSVGRWQVDYPPRAILHTQLDSVLWTMAELVQVQHQVSISDEVNHIRVYSTLSSFGLFTSPLYLCSPACILLAKSTSLQFVASYSGTLSARR